MTWIWILLIVVVLGATAAVAIGRGDSMARAYPDRPDVRLPADRQISSEDLEDLEFSVVLRGYRMDEVDDVIRRLTSELADRDTRLAFYEGRRRRAATLESASGDGAGGDGVRRDGSARDGLARDEAVREGVAQDGAVSDGSGRDKSASDGADR